MSTQSTSETHQTYCISDERSIETSPSVVHSKLDKLQSFEILSHSTSSFNYNVGGFMKQLSIYVANDVAYVDIVAELLMLILL